MTLKKSLATLLLLASAAHAAPTLAQRTAAARATAQDAADCQAVQPFYWSIGDAHGVLADGSAGRRPPTATTPMPAASAASRRVYAAYVAEQRQGQLTDDVATHAQARRCSALARGLDARDVDLAHRHHRLEGALAGAGVRVLHGVGEGARGDLP